MEFARIYFHIETMWRTRFQGSKFKGQGHLWEEDKGPVGIQTVSEAQLLQGDFHNPYHIYPFIEIMWRALFTCSYLKGKGHTREQISNIYGARDKTCQ